MAPEGAVTVIIPEIGMNSMGIGLPKEPGPFHRTPVRRALGEWRSCESQKAGSAPFPQCPADPGHSGSERGSMFHRGDAALQAGCGGSKSRILHQFSMRGECWFSERFHTPFDTGSIPVPATNHEGLFHPADCKPAVGKQGRKVTSGAIPPAPTIEDSDLW